MTHLDHVFVPVTNLAIALGFYQALLPTWSVRWRGSNSVGRPWVHSADPKYRTYLSLSEAPDAARAEVDETLNLRHLGFSVPSLDDVISRSLVEPKDVVEEPVHRRAYFLDPDGHEVEFIESL
jgi:catechol 2,3-dioxygenase-like lactoylglutathione lyase family enzyme